jgi:phospholipid-binding lipoprotein MlaA
MKTALRLVILFLAVTLSACASAPSSPQDPLEPMNRAIYKFNDVADRNVAKPLAEGYRNVTPQPLRSAIGNFFDNIRDLYSLGNNILRAEPEKAANDLMRVAINTTFGLFGLIDFATPAGLKNNKNNFGDTLATWGWKNSSYLVIPLLGPSTVRDGTGLGLTTILASDRPLYGSAATANIALGVNMLSRRESLLGVEDTVNEAALDPYSYTRDAFMQIRTKQVGGTPAESQQEELNIDELVDPASAPAAEVPPATPATPASAPMATAAPHADASAAH